jgi:hypothetical protein
VTLSPGGSGWAFTLSPARMRDIGVVVGDEVLVELAPEGPQRADLAEDISAALAANSAAAAFFDTLAQFYRKAYLRWIDATTRRPQVRAARIAEVVDLLAARDQGAATIVSATSVLQMDWPESISAPRLANPGCGPATAVLTCWAGAQNTRIWVPSVLIPPEPIPAHIGGSGASRYGERMNVATGNNDR